MSIQIKKKFLRSNSVDGSKVLFLNEDSFNALKADGSAEVSLFKLDSQDKLQFLEMPHVSADPSSANELTRKSYVDGVVAAEAAARVAADQAEAAARAAADESIRSDFAEADLSILQSAKDYTDETVAEEAAIRASEDSDIRSEFAAADSELRSDLDQEISTRASEDARVLSESKAYTDLEKARAIAREAQLQTEIDAEEALRASEDVRILSEAKAYTDTETARAISREGELQSEIDAEELAREAEDLTLLKLDGSRPMQGNLSMGDASAGGSNPLISSGLFVDDGMGTPEANLELTFSSPVSGGAIFRTAQGVPVGPDSIFLTVVDVDQTPLTIRDVYFPVQSDVYYVPEIHTSFGPENDFANAVLLGTASATPSPGSMDPQMFTVFVSGGSTTSYKIVNLADGVDEKDAVNKGQLDEALSDANAYTDSSIAAVINMAPEAYDTLKEIADYIAQDITGTTQILLDLADHESRLDIIEGTGEGSIAKAEQDAKDYTDAEVLKEKQRAMAAEAAEATLRASEDARVLGEAKAYTDLEKVRAMGEEAAIRSEFAAADAAIQSDLDDLDGYAQDIRSDLDQEILDRIADVDAEETRAMAREAQLQSEIDAEESLRASEDVRVLSEAKAYTDAEKTRAMAREAQLQTEIDAEESLRASEDIRVLSEAKAYTDQKVAAVVGSAPELLDTLQELAAALGNDENFATSVTSYIAAAKEEAKTYAETQVDALGERFVIKSFVVTQAMIDNGYADLQHKAFEMSIVASIDRLMLVDGLDYAVSIVDGVTRLTFAGSILPAGEEPLAVDDVLRIRYLKDTRA